MSAATIDIRKSFAEFGIRLFAFGLDLFLLFWIAWLPVSVLPDTPVFQRDVFRATLFLLGLLYFAGAWASPLQATPAQLLTGIRVIDGSGERLDIRRALLRAASLLALYLLVMFCFWSPAHPLTPVASVVAFSVIFSAAVTPNRQAGHDLLANSIVVNRRAVKVPEQRAVLLAHVADPDRRPWNSRRPSVFSIIGNAVVLLVPMAIIATAVSAAIDMDIRSRVVYAVEQTRGLQHELMFYREEHGRWPAPDTLLPFETGGRYPAGGGYELERDGVIRIRFDSKRQLRYGSLVLRPAFRDGMPAWQCHAEGGIERRYLPSLCRV
ncbi:MAG: RDD family protein [Woeseiaceae bacterium]|nr:RDD family protein [Woeseiaceae bacterium]